MLQRRCACGTQTGGGECGACARRASRAGGSSRGPREGDVPPIVHDVLRESGEPLDAGSRGFMESRFGRDFSGVRVHTSAQAARSAEAVDAEAYTVGHDVVLGPGHDVSATAEGRRLLAHELAHVVQQDGAAPAPHGPIVLSDSGRAEADADHAADSVLAGAPPAVGGPAAGLQRQETAAPAPAGQASPASPGGAPAGPCIEEVVGEDIPSLLQAGVVTIVEFGADWCGPCRQNKTGLEALCRQFRVQAPAAPVRIYSVDVDAAGNEAASRAYAAGGVPHLYIYVGSTEKVHVDFGVEPDVMSRIVGEQVEYASTAGWWRGAKSGMKWGLLPGAAAGLAGAIAIGSGVGGLEGNAQMAGILGALGGGLAAGALLGGIVGGIAGAAGDDRNRGPRQQKRRRLQPKSRRGPGADPLEREADEWAAHVGVMPSRAARPATTAAGAHTMRAPAFAGGGESLDAATRELMESRFGRDFSRVRLHRDPPAQRVADDMNAYAVTRGTDVYFAADGYAPATPRGLAILGHELAHVAQHETPAAGAPPERLEREADHAAAAIADGRRAVVRSGADHAPLALTRGQKTAAGLGIGAVAGAGVGALAGLGIAALMPGHPYGDAAGIGAIIGGVVGLIAGGLYGRFARNRTPETVPEAEILIRRRYGQYIGQGVPAPLHSASVHVVSAAELCERRQCRTPAASCNLIGWTDTGPPVRPITMQRPAPLASAADEPTCHGVQMEHATPQRPVIYYVRDSDKAGTLIHEGLHAYSHPDFVFLHNYVNEGVTEYFTRKLQDDINMPHLTGYDDEVVSVEALVAAVGEEVVARAYFGGAMAELHRAFNARFGRCALITWAMGLDMGSPSLAADVLAGGRDSDYCQTTRLLGFSAAERTPGEPTYQAPSTPPPAPPHGGQ